MKVGMIGLGIMGKPMARNVVKAGYDLTVFDINKTAVDELVAAGAKSASKPAEISRECDVIVTMLPNSPHVKEVVMGDGGVLESARAGTVLVDMSSIAPLASREIYEACGKKGMEMIDAPVSGGELKAIDGTLSIMAGGKKEIFEKVYDLLMSMGNSVVWCGEIGAGNTTKLVNQIVVALNMAAVAEGWTLAVKAGVDPRLVHAAIKGGMAGSNVMNVKAVQMMDGNYKPGFKLDLHIKDLLNAIDTGHGVGAPLPLTTAVMEMMQTLRADGHGQDDHSIMAKYYEKLTGATIEADYGRLTKKRFGRQGYGNYCFGRVYGKSRRLKLAGI